MTDGLTQLIVHAGLWLPCIFAVLIAWPEYSSRTVRRLAGGLLVALILGWGLGVQDIRAQGKNDPPPTEQSQPVGDPCDICTYWWCFVVGCF